MYAFLLSDINGKKVAVSFCDQLENTKSKVKEHLTILLRYRFLLTEPYT